MTRELTLYHHTTPAAAVRIMSERRMLSASPVELPYAFFSTRRHGHAAGALYYGDAAVEVRVPEDITEVDESFRDGERYVRVPLDELEPEHFIRAHLPGGRQPLAGGTMERRHEPPALGVSKDAGRRR